MAVTADNVKTECWKVSQWDLNEPGQNICDKPWQLIGYQQQIDKCIKIIQQWFEDEFSVTVNLPGIPFINPAISPPTGPEPDALIGNVYPPVLGEQGFHRGNVFPYKRRTFDGTGEAENDPIHMTLRFTRLNFEILIEALEDRGVDVSEINLASLPLLGCRSNQPLSANIPTIAGKIVDSPDQPGDPDGDPVPGSEIPTFGPGTATDPDSCFDINPNATQGTDAEGNVQFTLTPAAGGGDQTIAELECACAFEAPEDGKIRVGADIVIDGDADEPVFSGRIFQSGIDFVVKIYDDANCLSLSSTHNLNGCGGSTGCDSDLDISGCCTSGTLVPISAGQFATVAITSRNDGDCTAAISTSQPWMSFDATTPANLC